LGYEFSQGIPGAGMIVAEYHEWAMFPENICANDL